MKLLNTATNGINLCNDTQQWDWKGRRREAGDSALLLVHLPNDCHDFSHNQPASQTPPPNNVHKCNKDLLWSDRMVGWLVGGLVPTRHHRVNDEHVSLRSLGLGQFNKVKIMIFDFCYSVSSFQSHRCDYGFSIADVVHQ